MRRQCHELFFEFDATNPTLGKATDAEADTEATDDDAAAPQKIILEVATEEAEEDADEAAEENTDAMAEDAPAEISETDEEAESEADEESDGKGKPRKSGWWRK